MALSPISPGGARLATAPRPEFARVLARTPVPSKPPPPSKPPAVPQTLERLHRAQRRLDHVLELAMSGKSFTAAELLSFQAQVYKSSQDLDLAGKVVEKAASGVKQVLQTQV